MNPIIQSRRTTGIPIVVSGPSGVGKGSVVSHVVEVDPSLILSVSMTTRPPRPGEEESVHYFFVSHERFRQAIEGNELAEWASVYGNFYGTPRRYLKEQFSKGLDVILDIDVQGAASIRTLYPEAVLVYILPPSLDILRERLFARAKGAGDDLDRRLQLARHEMRFLGLFDFVIINDQLEDAVLDLHQIIATQRLTRKRLLPELTALGIVPTETTLF